MKIKYILILLVSMALGGIVSSCYEDNSRLDTNTIAGVEVDKSGMEAFIVYQFENLMVSPKVNSEGLLEEDLRYEWRINTIPNDTLYQLIGEEKNLDYEVRFKPTNSEKYHQLHYTVIDNNTGLKYITTWQVTIKNNIGEGLVVAQTNDGINTDISHIMAPEVTPDYLGESIKINVFSAINGRTIEGLVKQMRFTTIYRVQALLGITANSVFRINTLDYTIAGTNDDLFYTNKSAYHPQSLGAIVQGDMYVGNNQLTGTYLGVNHAFGIPFDFPYSVPDHVAFNAFNNWPPVRINFYDELNQHFVYMPGIAAFVDHEMHNYPSVTVGAFDPATVSNKTNVAAIVSNEGDFRHLLKDKTTGKYSLYVLDGGVSEYPNIIPPAPKALYDFSGAPDISNAKYFVLLDDQKVMYYATSNKIYAALYSTSTPVFEERYTVQGGEEITTLQIYQQADYPYSSGPYLDTNNKQLVMSTYNNTEGKVYILPFINTGLGNIDNANIKTFTGFSRITAITTQK